LTTSNGDVTIAPAIPPRLSIRQASFFACRADAHLPAAECFQPSNFRRSVCGGDAVEGGIDEEGEAEGIKRDDEELPSVESVGNVDEP
jgi:hypothetical protein